MEQKTDRSVVHPSQAMRADENATMASVPSPDIITEEEGELYLGEVKFTEKKPSKGHMGKGRKIEQGELDISNEINQIEGLIEDTDESALSMRERRQIQQEVNKESRDPDNPEDIKNTIDLIGKKVSKRLKGLENITPEDRETIEKYKKKSVTKRTARQGSREWFEDGITNGLLSNKNIDEYMSKERQKELRKRTLRGEFKTEAVFVHDDTIGETITGGKNGLANDEETNFDRVIIYRTNGVTN